MRRLIGAIPNASSSDSSAVATTVLQVAEIPPRPRRFDGKICLFGLVDGVAEAAIRSAFSSFGTILSCELEGLPQILFATHDEAVDFAASATASSLQGICAGVSLMYNERSYDGRAGAQGLEDDHGRGWCVFEDAVSDEVVARLNPRARAALAPLPPKKLRLVSGLPPAPVEPDASELQGRVAHVISRVERATFTGSGDKARVVALYREYTESISGALLKVLATTAAEDEGVDDETPKPAIATARIEAAAQLRFARGQTLLVAATGSGAARVGTIDAASGDRLVLGGRSEVAQLSEITFKDTVVPWHPLPGGLQPAAWWQAMARSDEVLPALQARLAVLLDQLNPKVFRVDALDVGAIGREAQAVLLEMEAHPALQAIAQTEKQAEADAATKLQHLSNLQATNQAALNLVEASQFAAALDGAILASKTAQEATLSFWVQAASNAPSPEANEGLRKAIERRSFDPEKTLSQALLEQGGLGLRRYPPGQLLSVLDEADGVWFDAEVLPDRDDEGQLGSFEGGCGVPHRLRRLWADGGVEEMSSAEPIEEMYRALHPWNHAPRELPAAAFDELRAWHTLSLQTQHSHMTESLSGRRLDTLKQCVAIDAENMDEDQDSERTGRLIAASVRTEAGGRVALRLSLTSLLTADALTAARWLCARARSLRKGTAVTGPSAMLLTAPPAAGKTTLLSQVMLHVLNDPAALVPILIRVQHLAVSLAADRERYERAWNWVDAYLQIQHAAEAGEASGGGEPVGSQHPAGCTPLYRMLRQALQSRRVLILLDGMDEGGTSRAEIERHVTGTLAPQGHVLLVTSRPAGLDVSQFVGFRRLALAPLTDAQQHGVLYRRLGARAEELIKFLERLPRDVDTGQRISSNPLMLSMVASVFEIRPDVGSKWHLDLRVRTPAASAASLVHPQPVTPLVLVCSARDTRRPVRGGVQRDDEARRRAQPRRRLAAQASPRRLLRGAREWRARHRRAAAPRGSPRHRAAV